MQQFNLHLLLDSSSEDDDEEEEEEVWRGSRHGKAKNRNPDFVSAHQHLSANYSSGTESTEDESEFETRVRRREACESNRLDALGEGRFVQKYDWQGNPGVVPLVPSMQQRHHTKQHYCKFKTWSNDGSRESASLLAGVHHRT